MVDDRKSKLLIQLSVARGSLAGKRAEMRKDFGLREKMKAAFTAYRGPCLLGAAVTAFLCTKLLPLKKVLSEANHNGKRNKEVVEVIRTDVVMSLLKEIFDLAGPFLIDWLKERVTAKMRTGSFVPKPSYRRSSLIVAGSKCAGSSGALER